MKDSLMVELLRFIQAHCDEDLSLKFLGEKFCLSPTHLQRRFRAVVGVSPKDYQQSLRLKKLKSGLRRGASVTEALYDAGFGSSSRLYEKLDSKIGMTPKGYRQRGANLEISYAFGKTSLGLLLIAATDRGICFLQFGDSKKDLLKLLKEDFSRARLAPMPAEKGHEFGEWMAMLEAYLKGEVLKLSLPLDLQGTVFQIKVWKFLQKIPRGETLSYAELASAMGAPRSARAVASACARNKIAIQIPCHRVLRGTGALAGYRWGLERKKHLLTVEKKS